MLLRGVHCLRVDTCHAVLLMGPYVVCRMSLQRMLLWRVTTCVALRMYVCMCVCACMCADGSSCVKTFYRC
jgi:hypothetical protein